VSFTPRFAPDDEIGEGVGGGGHQALALLARRLAGVAQHARGRQGRKRAEALGGRREHRPRIAEMRSYCFFKLALPNGLRGHGHHHRRLGLAGMENARLILQQRGEGRLGQLEIGGRRHHETGLALDVGQEGVERGHVAAVAVDDQHPLEAMTRDGADEADQQSLIGRDVQGEGAAMGHVVLGHPDPERRRDDHWPLRHRLLCCDPADRAAERRVDAGAEMRAVLLGRGDRKEHRRLQRGEGVELGRCQLRPFDDRGHAVPLRLWRRRWPGSGASRAIFSSGSQVQGLRDGRSMSRST